GRTGKSRPCERNILAPAGAKASQAPTKEDNPVPDRTVPALTFDSLHSAIVGNAAAARIVTRLSPAGGEGDKVCPPTYKHPAKDQGMYALEDRRIDSRQVPTVLLDSAASQANRMEEALLLAFERGECDIPILSVTIPRSGSTPTRVTVLDAPHRVT